MHVAKNSKFSKSIVWAALFLSGTGMAVAADYDGVVIIGDSLSDGGYYSADNVLPLIRVKQRQSM